MGGRDIDLGHEQGMGGHTVSLGQEQDRGGRHVGPSLEFHHFVGLRLELG